MLGVNGCSYFEHPVPFEHFEYGCANPIRIEKDGCVSAPRGPGLGLDIQCSYRVLHKPGFPEKQPIFVAGVYTLCNGKI